MQPLLIISIYWDISKNSPSASPSLDSRDDDMEVSPGPQKQKLSEQIYN